MMDGQRVSCMGRIGGNPGAFFAREPPGGMGASGMLPCIPGARVPDWHP